MVCWSNTRTKLTLVRLGLLVPVAPATLRGGIELCRGTDPGGIELRLGAMVGGGYVNYFSLSGRSYKVIPQVMQKERLNANQLSNYYINTSSGASVPDRAAG